MLPFRSHARSSAPAAPAPAPLKSAIVSNDAGPSPELSQVLDALSALLRAYGRWAFDTDQRTGEDTRATMQQWMLHATVGAPSPTDDSHQPGGGLLDRDWSGLLNAFASTRKTEAEYVSRTQDDLRASIWSFVSGLHRLVVEEHEDDKTIHDHVTRVRSAIASGNTEQLRQDAAAAMSVLVKVTETRRDRQRQQFSQLAGRLRELGDQLEEAKRESAVDPLTQLPNRRGFDAFITRTIELNGLTGQWASLLVVDIDNFKGVNDKHGHPIGDQALQQLARALNRTFLRRQDFVCRLGGDEFAIVLQETTGSAARALGGRLQKALEAVLEFPLEGEVPLSFTVSVGIAELELGDNAEGWLTRADAALYKAKSQGRDQVVF